LANTKPRRNLTGDVTRNIQYPPPAVAQLALTLRTGSRELTRPSDQDGDFLLEHFTNRTGPFRATWVGVEPGNKYIRYDEVVAVEVSGDSGDAQ
jgi:hypothetical protein